MRVIKNNSKLPIEYPIRGKVYKIKPKGSLTITVGNVDEIADTLLTRYSFLRDITPKQTFTAPKGDAQVKKVVKKATSKPSKKGVRKQ